MRRDELTLLFDYLYWVRDQVLTAAAELNETEFVSDATVTTRDLRATRVHELDVQWSWRERLRSGAFPDGDDLDPADYATLDAIGEHWRRDEAEMRRWLESLTDEQLQTPLPGQGSGLPLWYFGMHLFSHGLQQFSEAAVQLSRAGHSPGDIGFLEFASRRAP